MSRCVCPSDTCRCTVRAGAGIQVEGVGSENQPFRIGAAPSVYRVALTSASPRFDVNAPGSSDVGSRAVFSVEIDAGVSATIRMPGGTTTAPFPALGSGIEFFISGTGTSAVAWTGGAVRWVGGLPAATDLGWYRFVFMGDAFTGDYLGAAYV